VWPGRSAYRTAISHQDHDNGRITPPGAIVACNARGLLDIALNLHRDNKGCSTTCGLTSSPMCERNTCEKNVCPRSKIQRKLSFLSKCNLVTSLASLYDTVAEKDPKSTRLRGLARPLALGGILPSLAMYLPLSVPMILFLASLYIPPRIVPDSIVGFLAFRGMLEGGAFNSIASPDPNNIANDVVAFVTLWSPGQYLVPGSFIWLGTNYGLALSLTTLIATLIGLSGWIRVARSFAVSSFVLFVFVLGLNTFSYITLPFRLYNGGELLLFAAAPWSLHAMRRAANKPPIVCFAISLLSAALLFFMKLTGLIVFATNVVAISLLILISQHRLNSSIIAMWVAFAVGALCFMMFWLARGPVAASGSTFSFSWFPIWFSATGVTISGISGLDFLGWFLGHPWVRIMSDTNLLSFVLGPLGLLLMVWVWLRLRHTRYRDMALLLLTIILLYAIVFAVMWLRGALISFEDRHFRYAGILFFLLLLTAIDQWRVPLAKTLACIIVIVLGFYGLKSSITGAYAQMQAGYYDPTTGISQDIVSPVILDYMRSEMTRHNFQRPIAVVPSPSAAFSLPGFRIMYIPGQYLSLEQMAALNFVGRAGKIFVVVQEEMLLNGKAEAELRSFSGYEFDKWSQMKLDGMVIYTQ
jgi:hypothetical protein